MRPAPFTVVDATTIDEAVAAAAAGGPRARYLAGGQDLLGELGFRRDSTSVLVSLGAVKALAGVTPRAGRLEVGATTRLRELETLARGELESELSGSERPVAPFGGTIERALAEMAAVSGPRAIRSLATPGGNLASRRPGTVWATALAALGARVRVVDSAGGREVDVATAIRATRRDPAALIASFSVNDRPTRLVVGRAPLPVRPPSLLASCAVAVTPDGSVARLALSSPLGLPRVAEGLLDFFDPCGHGGDDLVAGLIDDVVADVLTEARSAEAGERPRHVLRTLTGRVVRVARGVRGHGTERNVIVDV